MVAKKSSAKEEEGKKVSLVFKKSKETKNTYQYTEVPAKGEPAIMGTMYLRKWFAEDYENIIVTVELS